MSKRASFRLISDSDLNSETSDRLWNLNNQQSDFVSMATHQIRTPLAGIKWTISMLLNGEVGPLNEEQKQWLKTSYEGNERVLKLIDEMLESIRIDEDKLVLEKTTTDIVALFKKVIELLSPQAREKKVHVSLVIEPAEAQMSMVVDTDKMQIAFQNLLENAIHYTGEKGEVKVRVTREEGDIKVLIQDSGIGIAEVEKKNIFERFFRAPNAFRIQEKGSGLGLFIAKGIIEKHSGKIWFESEEGKGTKFYFIIPTSGA